MLGGDGIAGPLVHGGQVVVRRVLRRGRATVVTEAIESTVE